MAKETILVLLLSVTAALLLTGSDACDGAPSMAAMAACQKASTGPLYQLCANTLGTSPEAEEVTNYVVAAANAATQIYVATKEAAGKVLADPSSSEDMKSACRTCCNKYDQAHMLVAGVIDQLHSCSLTDIRTDCATAVAAIDDCATAVLPVGGNTSLYAMVLLGRDRSVLVLRLAMLLVPNKLVKLAA
ncbi:hypothetical protein E2562_038315 [Oryza meyeriana var. granulata]|uniref:Pectinesterase inhibitor domain-containing protein n=1 Tax=Oryza meyeriana var. granulata TaxID=110450 RepID=A0A6G1CLZ4_9ORYZ|nr:hypothetical protein E2562_038315 [Oryza meyeriana var. granulata]